MRKHTPALNPAEKEDYIRQHLSNELRWLLCAATEWFVQQRLALGEVGYDVQVYAMDSAFLHARSLFEFFTQCTKPNHYGANSFLSRPLTSNLYGDWCGPLHAFLMHAQDRSRPRKLKVAGGATKDLNQMPVEFANEILRLWKEFENELARQRYYRLHSIACQERFTAIQCAGSASRSLTAQCHAYKKGLVLAPIFAA